jgi:hypothetical protein
VLEDRSVSSIHQRNVCNEDTEDRHKHHAATARCRVISGQANAAKVSLPKGDLAAQSGTARYPEEVISHAPSGAARHDSVLLWWQSAHRLQHRPRDVKAVASLSVHARTLQKAAEILGDERALSRYLQVPLPQVVAWIHGVSEPPRFVFLKSVDIVLDAGGARRQLPYVQHASLSVEADSPETPIKV